MANKAIRGITVEIGGDTTKLGKAIADSEKKSRSLQVELREIEKLLKFDPTNTELLAQKQKVLADMVEETSKRLNTLKDAEADVVKQFEAGKIGEEQYRAFQREIAKTEKTLADLSNELDVASRNLKEYGDNNGVAKAETDKLKDEIKRQNEALEAEKKALNEAEQAQKDHADAVEKAKQEVAEFEEKVSDAANTLKTGAGVITGAALAGGGYALKTSIDFDKALNGLVTKTGASKKEVDKLNQSMTNVYKNNFGDSIEDVADSMAIVKNNTKLTGEELEKTTEYALLMRDVFEFDVNESTRTAKMLMDSYGMSAEDAYNLIAQGAQNGLDKNGDLLDTINEYSVHFSSLGIGAEEMFNMLVNGAANGTFSVDKLGDAVKEFGIRAKDGSDSTADAFETLGLSVDKTTQSFAKGGEDAKSAMNDVLEALFAMEDPVEQNRVGVELFGTMWEDLGAKGVEALFNVQGEIKTTNDALGTINDQKYDDIGSSLEELGRVMETELVEPIGEELKPLVEELIDYIQENGPQIKEIVTELVEKTGEFVKYLIENGPVLISIIGGIGTGMLIWNMAPAIMGVVTAIKAYKAANEDATIAQVIFNAVLKQNPIVVVISVIMALVAAFILLWNNCEEFRNFWINLWQVITKWASDSWKNITKWFSDAWKWIQDAWNNAPQWFAQKWKDIQNAWSGVKKWFGDLFGGAWRDIKNKFSEWGSWWGGLWEQVKTKFSNIGTKIGDAISGAVKSGINGIISDIESKINGGIGLINGAISLINKIPGVSIGKMKYVSFPRLARGGIVDEPTLAEIGEDGREAIIPLEKNTGWLRKVARELNGYMHAGGNNGAELAAKLDRIYDRLTRLQVVLDSGELVGGILDPVDEALSDKYDKLERGW